MTIKYAVLQTVPLLLTGLPRVKSYTEAVRFELTILVKYMEVQAPRLKPLGHASKIYTEEVGFEPTAPFRVRLFSRQLL